MQEISERAAAALGGADAVIDPFRGPIVIYWKDMPGVVQDNYRNADMGCPKKIPDVRTAAAYLEAHGKAGFFVILRDQP